MPLQQLVAYFNQRFIEEQGLVNPPLRLKGQVVEGQCDGVWFGSVLQPVHQTSDVSRVIAYNAALKVVEEAGDIHPLSKEQSLSDHAVIHLDRLSRTVHMLNFLVFSHEVRNLFLEVHPRHILAVDRDHGAYFEEIILRCGLSPQRIVISLTVNQAYCNQIPLLLNRLKNYHGRGYATALKFKNSLSESLYAEILDQFTPDFISFDGYWLEQHLTTLDMRRTRPSTLLARIRQHGIQLLVEGVTTRKDAEWVEQIQADAVQGEYYRQMAFNVPLPVSGTPRHDHSLRGHPY